MLFAFRAENDDRGIAVVVIVPSSGIWVDPVEKAGSVGHYGNIRNGMAPFGPGLTYPKYRRKSVPHESRSVGSIGIDEHSENGSVSNHIGLEFWGLADLGLTLNGL